MKLERKRKRKKRKTRTTFPQQEILGKVNEKSKDFSLLNGMNKNKKDTVHFLQIFLQK